MTVNYADAAFLGLFLLVLASVALFATLIAQGDRRWWRLFTCLSLLVVAAFVVGDGWSRRILLDGAVFLAALMISTRGGPEAARAGRLYLSLMLLSIVCITSAVLLLAPGRAPLPHTGKTLILALVIIGFGLKLAFVPFYFWLPAVAEAASPMTTAVIVSVLDAAAFFELAHLRQAVPWVFMEYRTVWITVALASMYGGALLALGQRDLKRMLAFSSIDDMGYLLLGLTAGTGMGLTGALAGAFGHSLSKLLLFGAVGVAETRLGAPLTLDSRGQAARFPICSVAFIVGALAVIGIPPTCGFVGRWRLYAAGAELGGNALVIAMMIATAGAVLYYARAIHRVWLGEAGERTIWPEARVPNLTLTLLVAVILALGMYPVPFISVLP